MRPVFSDTAILAAGAALALGIAFVAQYGFGLAPCELCIYQRIPYGVVIALGLIGALAPARYGRIILWACAACFLADAAIAAFHVGVEERWWEGTTACGSALKDGDLESLRQQIMNAPRARCEDKAWSFLGISMAGYNAFYALALCGYAVEAARKAARIK